MHSRFRYRLSAMALSLSISALVHAQQTYADVNNTLPVLKKNEQIDSSIRSHSVAANLKENPAGVPESSKMETALNALLTSDNELGLSKEDIGILASTNRTTENGAREYSSIVQARAKSNIKLMCDSISLESGGEFDLSPVLETMKKIGEIEEEDAQVYWRNVVSRLSSYGQQSYTSTHNSLANMENIGISHVHLDWVGFGAENPQYMSKWVERICINSIVLKSMPQQYDPALRIRHTEERK